MRIVRLIEGWLARQDSTVRVYGCVECDMVLDHEDSACPDCGGEIAELVVEPKYLYRNPLY